jgi:hypothetical protein
VIEPQTFHPPRLRGLIFQGMILVLLAAAGFLALWQASNIQINVYILISFLPLLVGFALIPFFLYRIQMLRKSSYILERDGFRLQWGLRLEIIPMNQVLWVRRGEESGLPIPLPLLRWPGSVYGRRLSSRGIPFEFMAATTSNLVLIATPQCIFAISPEDPEAFLGSYQRVMELGSLTPLAPVSTHPSSLLERYWSNRVARVMLLVGTFLSLLLTIWVVLVIPGRSEIFFRPGLSGTAAVPVARLLLLPFLSSVFFSGDLLLGLFLFRRAENIPERRAIDRALAYLLWGSGVLVPALFTAAVIFILRSG